MEDVIRKECCKFCIHNGESDCMLVSRKRRKKVLIYRCINFSLGIKLQRKNRQYIKEYNIRSNMKEV